jgi:hypothetical protein
MNQFTITKGSRQVVVIGQEGRYYARLYVNHGETATQISWKGKTENGARCFAEKALAV